MDVGRGTDGPGGLPQGVGGGVGGATGALELEHPPTGLHPAALGTPDVEVELRRRPGRPGVRPLRRDGRNRPGRPALAVVGLAALALVTSVLVSRLVFPHFSVNNDEPIYVFQARLLLDGRLTLPAGTAQDFFRPWMSGPVGDRIVLVFPPVLPALLAAGQLLLGNMRTVLGLLAAAGVLLTARLTRDVTGSARTAVLAALLMAVCPLFVIQSGLFLSYVLGLDLVLATAVLLRGAAGRHSHRHRWFTAAGAVLGLLAFARPLDAVLAGLPLVAVALLDDGDGARLRTGRGRLRAGVRALGAIVLGAATPLTLMLVYDNQVTGSPLRFPLAAVGGDNALGFGLRYMASGTRPVRYDAGRALWATGLNLGSLPAWLPGNLLLVALAAIGLHGLRRRPWAWALAALTVTMPLGYLFYWGNLLVVQGRRSIGPHYYLSMLIPLVVLGAAGLQRIWSARRRLGIVVLAVLIGSAVHGIDGAIHLNRRQVALHERERALLDAARLDNAVVIVPASLPDGPWLGHPRPTFMNDPGGEGSVLFAADLAGRNFELLDRYSGRTFVRQLSRTPPGRTRPEPQPTLWWLDPRAAPAFRLRTRLTNTDGQPVIGAYLTDGARSASYVVDRRSSLGRTYELTWTVSASGITLEGAAEPAWEQSLQQPTGAGTLAVGVSFGQTTDRRTAWLVETRFWYRVRAGGPVELMLPGEAWRKAPGLDRKGLEHRWQDLDLPDSWAVDVTALG